MPKRAARIDQLRPCPPSLRKQQPSIPRQIGVISRADSSANMPRVLSKGVVEEHMEGAVEEGGTRRPGSTCWGRYRRVETIRRHSSSVTTAPLSPQLLCHMHARWKNKHLPLLSPPPLPDAICTPSPHPAHFARRHSRGHHRGSPQPYFARYHSFRFHGAPCE